MNRILFHRENYRRDIDKNLVVSSNSYYSPFDDIDISTIDVPSRVLNFMFDILEGKTIEKMISQDFISLISAFQLFQLLSLIPNILANFRNFVDFKQYEFSEIVFIILNHGVDPKLSFDDLRHLPVYDPFEKFIIDISKTKDLDYSLFSTTEESRYSSLMPWHLENVRKAFLTEIPEASSIVDLTAHIGVDSIFFKILYPRAFVSSFEIDPNVFLRLRDNLVRYAIFLDRPLSRNFDDAVELAAYNIDSTTSLDHPFVTRSDIVYIDPPWGGPEYRFQQSINLYLGSMEISGVISHLLSKGIKHIVLKAPENINRKNFLKIPSAGVREYKIYTKASGGKVSYILFFFHKT